MSRYQPYPVYKDSGVEWLGQVPGHWDVVPLRHVISTIESGTSVNSTDTPAGEGEYGVLKTSCVYSGTFEAGENKAVVPEEYDRVACPVTAGTLVVSRMNAPDLVGAAGLVTQGSDSLFLPDRLWKVSFSDAEPAFAHYWTLTGGYRAQVQIACAGTSSSMQNLAQDQFKSFFFPKPSLNEQSAIALFLDSETAKIDGLMAEQQRLIALLKEKRQAVIAHAVTKGLSGLRHSREGGNPVGGELDPRLRGGDDAVKMKDSGVEWLGEVPSHWEVMRMASLFQETSDSGDDSLPVLSVSIHSGVSDKELNDSELDRKVTRSDDRGKYKRVQPDDLVYNMMRAWQGGFGTVTVLGQVSPAYVVARPIADFFTAFIEQVLRTPPAVEEMRRHSQGVTDFRLRLYWQEFKCIQIALPAKVEQQAILAFIAAENGKLEALEAEAKHAINLLKERRGALISAAVTGQIDVRGLVTEDAA